LKRNTEPSAALKSPFEKQPPQAKRHSKRKKEVIYPAVIVDNGVEIPLVGWTEVYIFVILNTFNFKGYLNIPNRTLNSVFTMSSSSCSDKTAWGVKEISSCP
jgi:hypothetical protein